MSGQDGVLVGMCIALALVVAHWLTPVIGDFVRRRTPEAVAPRTVGYPIVAGATGLGFAASALRFGRSAQLLVYLFLVAVLVVLSFVDLATTNMPRPLVDATLVGGVLLLVPIGAMAGEFQRVVWAGVGALGALIVLTALHFATRGGLDFGDVRLGAALGWYLAWQGLPYVPVGLFLALVLSALTGLALIALGRAGRRTAIPFGPFLAVGAVLALVLGGPSLVNA